MQNHNSEGRCQVRTCPGRYQVRPSGELPTQPPSFFTQASRQHTSSLELQSAASFQLVWSSPRWSWSTAAARWPWSWPAKSLHKDWTRERALKEHLDVPMDTSKMSLTRSCSSIIFKMHDTDRNNKLDGCELVKSLIHWPLTSPATSCDSHSPASLPRYFSKQGAGDMIDPILVSDDRNKDGFIDYYEFVAAQECPEPHNIVLRP